MISTHIKEMLASPGAGAIRKMFEEGRLLKEKFGEENVYDFSLGNPSMCVPDEVLSEIKMSAEDAEHGYMQNAGYSFVREEMAKKTSLEQELSVGSEHIVMACGAAGALNVVLKSILNPSDEVIVIAPYFSEYNHYVQNHGGKIVCVKSSSDFSLSIENIENALTEKTAAIIINSPNNPTGKIYSKDKINLLSKKLLEHSKKYSRLPYIILDEPYRAITYGKTVPAVFPLYENTILVTSFAKNLSIPGERLGYIAINPRSSDASVFIGAATFATRILGFVNAPAFFQKVVAKTWNVKVDYSCYEKNCNHLKNIMSEVGLSYVEPEGAFYLFVKVPDAYNGDDMLFVNHLKKYNILCTPGTSFAYSGYVRFAFCVSEKTILNSRNAFKKAMRKS